MEHPTPDPLTQRPAGWRATAASTAAMALLAALAAGCHDPDALVADGTTAATDTGRRMETVADAPKTAASAVAAESATVDGIDAIGDQGTTDPLPAVTAREIAQAHALLPREGDAGPAARGAAR